MIGLMLAQTTAATTGSSSTFTTAITSLATTLDQQMFTFAYQTIYCQNLGPVCYGIASVLLPSIIVAEVNFIGIRVLTGQSMIEQFLRLIEIIILTIAVLFLQIPQQVITQGMLAMKDGGATLCGTIVGDSTVSSPAQAWIQWIGQPGQSSTSTTPFRFDPHFIRNRIFGQTDAGQTPNENTTYGQMDTFNSSATPNQATENLFQALNGQTGSGSSGTGLVNLMSKLWSSASALDPGQLVYFLMIDRLIMMALTIAPFIVAAYMAPTWAMVGLLAGTYITYFTTMALGLAVLPLIFFRKSQQQWQDWLRFLFSISLIPCLYNVFGAIGFKFSTMLFDQIIFPPNGTFATWLNQALAQAVVTGLSLVLPIVGAGNDTITQIVKSLLALMLMLSRGLIGVMIICAFISIGTSFALLSVDLAFRWQQMFANQSIMGRVQQSISEVGNAIGAGFGTAYQQGAQTATSMVQAGSGAVKGFLGH